MTRHFGMLAIGWALSAPALGAAEPPPDWLKSAPERIAKHRQSELVIRVVDAAGKPVPGAEIAVEQTRHAFLFGCNIFGWGRQGNPADESKYRDQFQGLFNFATLPFYWWDYEFERGRTQEARIRAIAGWCKERGITVKGHPLAWNLFDPRWLPDNPDEVYRLQMERIVDCMTRFRGVVDVWDVVNEATQFDRESASRQGPKITGMWKKTGQVEFVRDCFAKARPVDPKAVLLINDYKVDDDYAAVIDKLVKLCGQRPFDVIGLQSHMHGGGWPTAQAWTTCERFKRFGVPLHFTELTLLSNEGKWEWNKRDREREKIPSTPAGEARQADEAVRLYTLLFSHPSVEAITWWDFSDRAAWMRAPAGLLREDLSPKPAYTRLRELIKNQWWTRAKLSSDAQGEARVRAFHGQHRIVVRQGGTQAEISATVLANAPNTVNVVIKTAGR